MSLRLEINLIRNLTAFGLLMQNTQDNSVTYICWTLVTHSDLGSNLIGCGSSDESLHCLNACVFKPLRRIFLVNSSKFKHFVEIRHNPPTHDLWDLHIIWLVSLLYEMFLPVSPLFSQKQLTLDFF